MRALLEAVAERLSHAPLLDVESRGDARREARLLVAAVLDLSPGDVARQIDRPLSADELERIAAAAARRERGEPLAYCAGRAAFRDLVLVVDARVLIPRPETEIVVAEALRVSADRPGGIAVDIGTGSGAIALALATEGRFERVIGTDVSHDALTVATENAKRLSAGTASGVAAVEFRLGADLAPLADVQARVIVSNPPYISFAEAGALPASVRDWEPTVALFASDDGMARYDAILAHAGYHLEPDGWLVLEVDATRAQRTADRASARGFAEVRLVRDLSGRNRVLVAKNSSTTTASGPEAGDHARR
jgi:release factor glutamine methyltransferase